MSKKDLIIIAVLANMGVLAILFMLAIRNDESPPLEHDEITYVLHDAQNELQTHSNSPPMETYEPIDEMDALLSRNNSTGNQRAFMVDEEFPLLDQESSQIIASNSEEKVNDNNDLQHFVEITIKRGDALEKIARANGTTVEAIKMANNLTTDRLKIGQVLQVPIGHIQETPVAINKSIGQSNNSEQYYTIKSGDNPWKIAKQFNIKVYELLQMNDLDEDKARNLKIGDQIKVR